MNQFRLILRTLLHYWKINLVLALGVAISTTVITGSLVVGDSVRSSLVDQVELRLGKATHSITAGDRFFTGGLSEKISRDKGIPSAPVLLLRGIAVANGGQQRVPNIQVLGVDEEFDYFAGESGIYSELQSREVVISENLAEKLGVQEGEQLLFRIRKASLIPLNAPFVSGEETSKAVRASVKAIAGDNELGRFDMSNSQTSPYNAFFSLEFLNELMDLTGRANLMLLEIDDQGYAAGIDSLAGEVFGLPDYSLDLHYIEDQSKWEVNSDRVFMEKTMQEYIAMGEGSSVSVLTYFVNEFRSGGSTSPYSFVSSLEGLGMGKNEIMVNSWLADDMGLKKGDSLELTYYTVGPLRELEEESNIFSVAGVFDMDNPLADPTLMPYLPGLSDAGNCRDWETGIPIDLDKIRDKDEDYWDEYSGTPKAIISYSKAKEIWSNRFGEVTALRFDAGPDERPGIEQRILNNISPSSIGFRLNPTKQNGVEAARKGTDFGQLFIGLSFFLLMAGIILTIVLFRLGVESRSQQLGTFSIMGYSKNRIRRIIFTESLMASITGIVLGLFFTIFYNKLIFSALNNVWSDIVRTDALSLHFEPLTLLAGAGISLAVIMVFLFYSLDRFLRINLVELHRKSGQNISPLIKKLKLVFKWATLILGIGLVALQLLQGKSEDAGMFFLAGGLLLMSFILFADGVLSIGSDMDAEKFGVGRLSIRNGIRNRTRSLSVIILFSLGVFLVVTTGANHKDPYAGAEKKSSGTGGFELIAQTTVPILQNINNEGVRSELGLNGGYNIVQLRKMNGDDASCLNLNRIKQPAILGIDPAMLKDRFSFVSQTGLLDPDDPWASVGKDIGERGIIPAIADQTIIKWGLGKEVGDTLLYQDESGAELRLVLIGGLANSIFQGHVIISNSNFLKYYPSSSGSSFFLIDGVEGIEDAKDELSMIFRDYGWDMDSTVHKLAEFNSVTNTYLSIFLILGALGLLIGTIGLAIVLVRNLLERRQELALFRAMGYSKMLILRIILNEYMGLLLTGLLAGGISAIIAVLPGLIKPQAEVSFALLLAILGIILVNGVLWIVGLAYTTIRRTDLVNSLRND